MADGFQLSVSAVTQLADGFADKQQRCQQVGGPLQDAVASIDTGDPGLDAETRAVVGRVHDVLGAIGDAWGRFADALNTAVEGYQQADQQVAAGYQSLGDDVSSTGTTENVPMG